MYCLVRFIYKNNMMKYYFKRILALIFIIPIGYLLIALLLTYITVNGGANKTNKEEVIYLKSNGVHLDIVLPSSCISILTIESKYVAVGWGDKDFYLNTPNFKDLTISTAFKALFLRSKTLLHLTNYDEVKKDWVRIVVTRKQLGHIANQINKEFNLLDLTPIKGYGASDLFYKAKGSYSCLFTCNTWINSVLKNASLKACIWTPFSFRLMNIYE